MRVQNFIVISLFTGLVLACNQKTEIESGKVEVTELTLVEIVDDVSPPPPDLTSNFKSLQDWLFSICDDKKPKQSIADYEFGLFESAEDYTIFLVGLNKYDKGDTSYTRIEFEPPSMYFQLPKDYYQNLNREQLMDKLTSQLKDFTHTEKFKTSFLSEADAIIFCSSGKKIWSK